MRQLINALKESRSQGIDLVSLQDRVDTSTPNGRLVFGIFASITEFEMELIGECVRSGPGAAEAKGKQLGGPRVTVDELRIAELRAEGLGWKAIAAELGVGVGAILQAPQ